MNLLTMLDAMPGAISQGLIWGIMAIGVYITYKILDIPDLSVDGTMCTGGAVFVVLTLHGVPIAPALVCAFISGLAAGFITGILHTACGIPAILSGILTQLALYSVNLRILGTGFGAGRSNLSINASTNKLLISMRNIHELGLSNPALIVLIFVVAIIILLYIFFGTELGCSMRATGANPNMSRAQGINTNVAKILGLTLSNGLVALSSALLAQYQGFADVNMGRGAIVYGLAAVVIGEVIFGKLVRTFWLKLSSVALGAVIYFIVYQVVIMLKLLRADDMKLITAAIVALFLAIPYWKGKYFSNNSDRLRPPEAGGKGGKPGKGAV